MRSLSYLWFILVFLLYLCCLLLLRAASPARHRPVRMKRILCIKKTMIVITIAFVSCFSWLRSGIERYADRKLSPCCQFFVSGFVGLLTYPFMCGGFPPCTNALLQPSLGAMTALPMTGFHRARITPYGKQCFRNTATLGSLPPGPARIARCPDSLPANPMG